MMIKINSQKDLDFLLSLPDWQESFIRECYLLSPSYTHSDSRIGMDRSERSRFERCETAHAEAWAMEHRSKIEMLANVQPTLESECVYIHEDTQETIAPDSAPMMHMLICTSDLSCPGIELLFEEVDSIYFACRHDITPVAQFQTDRISFSFHGNKTPEIHAKCLYYRILGKECWGWKVRYGIKNFFDMGGFLLPRLAAEE